MSMKRIMQGFLVLASVMCGLIFSLASSGLAQAASVVPGVHSNYCGSDLEWYYITSDTKYQTYTYNYPGVGQVSLTLQVHVELQAEFGDAGYCGRMRSQLTVSKSSCSSSDTGACNVYGTAQVYFVFPSGYKTPPVGVSGDAGASQEIIDTTSPMYTKAGAAGGSWSVSGYPTVQVGTAQEPY
ncbi:MAG TPA: hypothetical protein VKV20_14220 [Ktedonobacteraceae bacterium]|nr:hypothetical protein [Ktedonobacteraceae bacterium]